MNVKSINLCLILFLALLAFVSCGTKNDKPPVNLKEHADIEVPYTECGGVKTIPVKLNGTEMDMILDTGCSDVSISLLEVQALIKSRKLERTDFLGTSYSRIANGDIVENDVVNLREVEIGGKDGIVLKNIKASVVRSMDAPLLLGNAVLDEVKSVEVDNDKKVIKFFKHK